MHNAKGKEYIDEQYQCLIVTTICNIVTNISYSHINVCTAIIIFSLSFVLFLISGDCSLLKRSER